MAVRATYVCCYWVHLTQVYNGVTLWPCGRFDNGRTGSACWRRVSRNMCCVVCSMTHCLLSGRMISCVSRCMLDLRVAHLILMFCLLCVGQCEVRSFKVNCGVTSWPLVNFWVDWDGLRPCHCLRLWWCFVACLLTCGELLVWSEWTWRELMSSFARPLLTLPIGIIDL